ncbi:YjjG family noncanonical pyrimidine nucleotidase [Heyndrickxia camelliae]|uniref:Noncanonical pyrimidine nucleotidase, YjjG family n=1 Tax=Heyndrickxia camelliae TaxID=1707093 RepID=A0A2N3LJ78_9BACI|nr:YjjG family noncanonical pyrimidine nucleotidase [Heyndrickxia camelliae]PKR84682.1 noncanonical pyrimidine nucleotidase, YjjG family [Heyndrickxia camelliae]
MKAYKALFFDVDDTLLDFRAAEREALRQLFEDEQIELTPEMVQQYKNINQQLWREFEEGKRSRDDVVNTRFAEFFKVYGKEVDGVLLENKYRNYLQEGHQLMDGALDLITELKDHYDLYIVTNGDSATQDKRLRAAGLYPFFKQIFVSEDTGYQKPMKEFFDYVFDRIPNLSPEQGLIIGDSLNADIKGGNLYGLDTCWFNPEKNANNTGILPTYEINSLNKLYTITSVKMV